MDRIQFAVGVEAMGAGATSTIQPVINGSALSELAAEAEGPAAAAESTPQLAGNYAGLSQVEEVRWPSRHFLGEPTLTWFGDGDTVLLGCTCGDWGCWPLTARVEVTDTLVRWSGFRTGHRDWDLSTLGPFEFDRAQYETALGRDLGIERLAASLERARSGEFEIHDLDED